MHITVLVWETEDSFQGTVLSFNHGVLGSQLSSLSLTTNTLHAYHLLGPILDTFYHD